MAVAYGFMRAGQWEFRYGTFWAVEARRIMFTPASLHAPTIPDN